MIFPLRVFGRCRRGTTWRAGASNRARGPRDGSIPVASPSLPSILPGPAGRVPPGALVRRGVAHMGLRCEGVGGSEAPLLVEECFDPVSRVMVRDIKEEGTLASCTAP